MQFITIEKKKKNDAFRAGDLRTRRREIELKNINNFNRIRSRGEAYVRGSGRVTGEKSSITRD